MGIVMLENSEVLVMMEQFVKYSYVYFIANKLGYGLDIWFCEHLLWLKTE